MTTIDRAKVIERIKAMRALSADSGATEGEADTAIQMAQRLMAQYQIDAGEIEASEYGRHLLTIRGVRLAPDKSHPFVGVGVGVDHIAGPRSFLSMSGLWVVGDAVGRELAEYLYELTHDTLTREWKRERADRSERADRMWRKAIAEHAPEISAKIGDKLPRYRDLDADTIQILREGGVAVDAMARRSFMTGIAYRMSKRMREMPPARAVADATVKRIMSDKNDTTGQHKHREPEFDVSALRSGFRRGNEVPINMGVGADRPDPLKISDRREP